MAFRRIARAVMTLLYALYGLYYLTSSPPLQLVYAKLPPAGPSSVYVPGTLYHRYNVVPPPCLRQWRPLAGYWSRLNHENSLFVPVVTLGGGFSGFWYHLGLFQGVSNLADYDYYCYSSGCLSLVLALLNTTVDAAFSACADAQRDWLDGQISRFELVDNILDKLVLEVEPHRLEPHLPRLNIIVSTTKDGAQVHQASNRDELMDLLIKTTWIPLVTGQGILNVDNERYLDGGFSRVLHPPCQHTAAVPITWDTLVHAFNPGFGRETTFSLYAMGQAADHPFSTAL